ncbi:MAG: DUF6491 family protein [Marinicella sp.]|nr:hypothetical protein [Xanthomonadales bacterium]
MKIATLSIAFMLLTACHNNAHQRPDYETFIDSEHLVQKDRVQQFRFQGWQPLDDRHLLLKSSQSKNYLVRLMSACTELPFAQSIQLKQDFATILNAKFDSIIVPGQFSQKCTIDRIYELTKEQKQGLLDFSNQREEIRD